MFSIKNSPNSLFFPLLAKFNNFNKLSVILDTADTTTNGFLPFLILSIIILAQLFIELAVPHVHLLQHIVEVAVLDIICVS